MHRRDAGRGSAGRGRRRALPPAPWSLGWWPWRRLRTRMIRRHSVISRHRTIVSRELGSMRQSWDLRPASRAGRRRGSGSALLTGCLLWLAAGQMGAARAQEPAAKGEAPAAKADAGPRRRGRRRRRGQGRRRAGRRRPPAEGTDAAPPREHAPVGDPGLGADRPLPALPLGLLHGPGDPPVHGVPGQRGRAARPGREARGRDPGQEVPGGLRRLQGQRLVPGPPGPHRHRQPAQRPARGQGGDDGDDRRDRHRHGA